MIETESQQGQGCLWASLLLSGLGVLISAYLSVKRVTGGSLACSRWAQCDVVNNSLYAKIYGVPVAFIGMTLKDTPAIVVPTGVAGLEFRDEGARL